jgi:hypothetical protein
MADLKQPLLNAVSPTATGTFYSSSFNTKDFRDFILVLRMPTTTGGGGDTLDIYIETSSDTSFTNYNTRVLTLTSPTGTQVTSFTQVVGGTTLPAATNTATILRQHWNVNDKNIDRYIRVRYVVAGTATSFTLVTVDVLVNRKV